MEFRKAVHITAINIYEIERPGGVLRIYARKSKDDWRIIWNRSPSEVGEDDDPPRIFSPDIEVLKNK